MNYLQAGIDVFLVGGLVGTWWGMTKAIRANQELLDAMAEDFQAARDLIDAEQERKEAHTRAFEMLSNPDEIVEEMEKSAAATEMRVARRTTLPREDAGPPAKVYRPKIRRIYPRSWPR